MKRDLIYSGKAKDIYSTTDDDVIIAHYKDQVTMLNGARKEMISGKGRLNNQISSFIFERLNAAGVKTHFIEKISETEQRNRRVEIIPLEVVLRNRVAGSFAKRFGLEEGQELPVPIIEFYYKDDSLDDPFINDEHVLFLGLASEADLTYIKEETRRINDLLSDWFAKVGFTLVDFKLEFGKDKNGDIILADEFSPDNCRLWDEQGRHMDKDVFRRDLGDVTAVYAQVLEKLQGLD
ncbi:phosphoribosylaminoimidazole-succinocarboxamide synthase [Streptococcus rupicaprae]|uniref:Phosphoribosylaminoimidazole-succinocarboxamide synthase n=1 Tax=Streptococcus rupicaprae TaxID=759619 RepID=A0ABV2FEF7_9STRE